MGAECPVCGIYAPYILAITTTGVPAVKNSDIIAKKLACGHVVGSTLYMQYRKELATLEETDANAIRRIQENSAKARLAIWAKLSVEPTGVA